jgi:hypothetical protein
MPLRHNWKRKETFLGQRFRYWRFLVVSLALIDSGLHAMAQQPPKLQLTALEPKTGTTTPGTKVKVYGQGFSTGTVVYFGGLEVREVNFVDPNTLDVVTPYLRPGSYQLQLKSGEISVRSDVTFTVTASAVDSDIDHASALAGRGQQVAAIGVLTSIAETNKDYQVRAFARYQAAQIYFAHGDWWRWAGEAGAIYNDADKSGKAVQTAWRYRLAGDQSGYFLPIDSDPDSPLKMADWTVEFDVTDNPEPRFFRALLNARYGNLDKAKLESELILKTEPQNPSYRALSAYIAALNGDRAPLQTFSGEKITDARALSLLGEAAYLSGDVEIAKQWWALEAKDYPLGASLAYWAGKKHFAGGQQRVAAALLTECATMAPDGEEAREAKALLSSLQRLSP